MNINEFNDNYLNELLNNLSKENKTIFLLTDFNIKLLNYDIHPHTNEFLDSLSSHYFLPHILEPSRVKTNTKILKENIFSNITVPRIISGNLTTSISDHLPQFLAAPNFNASYPRSNNCKNVWSRFDQENFVLDYFSVNWDNLLLSSNTNTEKSYKTFLGQYDSLLETYAPLSPRKIQAIQKSFINTNKKVNNFNKICGKE